MCPIFYFGRLIILMKMKPLCQFDEYEPVGKIYIKNPLQAARYRNHGAKLYDLIVDKDCWMWVFDMAETRELFDLWCKRELE